MGKHRAQASYDGRQEIGFTALSITLVDVVVFLPIIFATGMVPNLLRQFCMTVLVSTLMSLLVSFTLVPWLTSRVGKVHRFKGKNLGGRLVLRFAGFSGLACRRLRHSATLGLGQLENQDVHAGGCGHAYGRLGAAGHRWFYRKVFLSNPVNAMSF